MQHIAWYLATAEMIWKRDIQLTFQYLGEWWGKHPGTLVVMALPGELFAFDKGDLDTQALLGGQTVEGQGTGRSAWAAADDNRMPSLWEPVKCRGQQRHFISHVSSL
jgi:hypothetical protein